MSAFCLRNEPSQSQTSLADLMTAIKRVIVLSEKRCVTDLHVRTLLRYVRAKDRDGNGTQRSLQQLADRLVLTVATCRRVIRRAAKHFGLLTITHQRRVRGGQTVNRYSINWSRVSELVDNTKKSRARSDRTLPVISPNASGAAASKLAPLPVRPISNLSLVAEERKLADITIRQPDWAPDARGATTKLPDFTIRQPDWALDARGATTSDLALGTTDVPGPRDWAELKASISHAPSDQAPDVCDHASNSDLQFSRAGGSTASAARTSNARAARTVAIPPYRLISRIRRLIVQQRLRGGVSPLPDPLTSCGAS